MANKVVTILAKTFQHLGWNTVRFNFRGVGQSAGQFDQGNGELADLMAIISWVKQAHIRSKICLAGFSFGAYIAAKATTQMVPQQLIMIAPPVQHFAMQALPLISYSWILVQGEKDEIVSPEAVFTWAETRDPKPTIIRLPSAGHFFHGQLLELQRKLEVTLEQIKI
jgi:alpha/beta superfamily hydrolase